MSAHAAQAHLESLIGTFPEYASKMLDAYQRRLWHQLSVLVEEFIELPDVKETVDLPLFFRKFVWDFANKLNQLTLVHFAVKISKQIKDLTQRAEFLKEIVNSKSIAESKEAHILLRSEINELKLHIGDIDGAVLDLDQCEKELENMSTADTSVFSAYYKARTILYKLKNMPQEFYRNGLQYLAYTKVESVDEQERALLAFDLGIAALMGEEIYNFGELLQNEVLEALKGTNNEWLAHVLEAFNNGNIAEWKQLEKKYSAELNAQPGLLSHKQLMDQKIAILGVMELVFSREAIDRSVSFSTISSVSQLPKDQVELLVMRADRKSVV